MQKPQLSIIMLAYNSSAYIGDAIESILSQTFTDLELIIIDDSSTDHSTTIIQQYRDPRVRPVYRERHYGISENRNLGLKLATGEYVAFFDSDDLAMPKKFETQIKYLESHPGYGFVGTSVIWIDEKGQNLTQKRLSFSDKTLLPAMLFRNVLVTSSVVFRRSLVMDFTFPNHLDSGEDYYLWWHLVKQSGGKILSQYLTKYRQHRQSVMYRLGNHPEADIPAFRLLLADAGLQPTEEELSLHSALRRGDKITSKPHLVSYQRWFVKLTAALLSQPNIRRAAVGKVILNRWLKVVSRSAGSPLLLASAIFSLRFYLTLAKILYKKDTSPVINPIETTSTLNQR